MSKEVIYKIVVAITTCIVAIASAVLMNSCRATRTYSVKCNCVQTTDSVQIHCATSESYVGKKLQNH